MSKKELATNEFVELDIVKAQENKKRDTGNRRLMLVMNESPICLIDAPAFFFILSASSDIYAVRKNDILAASIDLVDTH